MHPSTAVHYALIGVYDKLFNPPMLSCLLILFHRLASVGKYCLALFFLLILSPWLTFDRYPVAVEWNK